MIHSKLVCNGQFSDAFDNQEFEELNYASMEQTHSDKVLEVDKPGIYEADALITKQKKLALVVRTADCMPVLISDNEKIGVIHIGWKGLENRIFFKTISKFNLPKLKISVGPHAKKCCYEVKEDLESKFNSYCIRDENKIYLDLSKEIRDFCKENKIDLEIAEVCTIENKKYNSYRRDKTKNRQKSKVWI
tara:strand:+ start:30 stop:599 length:570 start_codon:yes stop_codon:yes gene_type:complete